ncbi:hypothetical protein KUTeg_020636 [Tegillarca granosa]|uniref:Uncharacterized protein n=1 Tax=Tegillarca granosa TaxID=220873 RepID=A0ABQ9EB01_TEGGR|nr:hypothetical protein KUTeg_020636 [Tegillarca granosa]
MSLIKGCPGVLYRSTDDRIRLYCCDFYGFNKSVEGQFQYIWDRSAFAVISLADRFKYGSIISELMCDNSRMLLETFDRNIDVDPGQPPFDFPEPEIRQHFNQQFGLEQARIFLKSSSHNLLYYVCPVKYNNVSKSNRYNNRTS